METKTMNFKHLFNDQLHRFLDFKVWLKCVFFISNIYQYTSHVCCSNIKKAKDETKKLETESKKMEEKLKELRMAMSREKEEREYV